MDNHENEMRRLVLAGITYNQLNAGVYGLILQEVGGERRIPIVIGNAEAHSIECKLQEIITPRPLTHDLMTNIFRAFGLKLEKVYIKRLDSGVYAADLHLSLDDRSIIIDARSSDAVALAIRVGAPIFTSTKLLDEVGIRKKTTTSASKPKTVAANPTAPKNTAPINYSGKTLSQLNAMLADAVENERYEEAAQINREIQSRRNKETDGLKDLL